MGSLHRRRICWLLFVSGIFLTGCTGEDTERLARVGHKVMGRAGALTGSSEAGLMRNLQAVRGEFGEQGAAGKVSARLRWDKSLADAKIEVKEAGGAIELKGSVRDQAQKQRAVELAESTEGVEKVTDSLEVAAKDLHQD
jgi:osmotically-inducible protein OsmY